MKLLLFEEGSLELSCGRGLDTPALPGDVRGGGHGASGRQAEAVAVQGEKPHTITRVQARQHLGVPTDLALRPTGCEL